MRVAGPLSSIPYKALRYTVGRVPSHSLIRQAVKQVAQESIICVARAPSDVV